MDEDRRKVVMIVIIVLCLGLAVGITFWNRRGRPGQTTASENVTLMCTDCGNVFEMNGAEFRAIMREADPGTTTMFVCPKCGKRAAVRAEKCPKCGKVFIPDTRAEYPDKCPECGYSRLEELEKKRQNK